MIGSTLTVLLMYVTVSSSHYSLGFCRTHLTRGGFVSNITLQELTNDGDYTVLYTSGLKNMADVECAHIGYTYIDSNDNYLFYSSIETKQDVKMTTYEIHQLAVGSFHVIDWDEGYEDDTLLYVMYKQDDVLLLYWCNYIPTDTFDNNIWIIAARTETVASKESKKAVLDMLYHDVYRGLIDGDIEVVRKETKRFIKLSPCLDNRNRDTFSKM